MLRSSHKVLTLRLGNAGYSVSAGSLRGGAWQRWPAGAATTSDAAPADAFEAQLDTLKLSDVASCSQLDVVLDSALTRVQVVRFPAGVRNPRERTAFLKAAFRNVYGRDADSWHIAAEPAYVNEATPAVAVGEKLMAAVSALAERHKLKLRSLRTSFSDYFNHVRRSLSAHVGAFALIEEGRVCLGLWRHRNWLAISTQAFAAADGEALTALCAQMLARVEPPMVNGTLYIAGAIKPFAVALQEGWNVEWLAPEPVDVVDSNTGRRTRDKVTAA
ncbi:hypothetical protein VVD49_13610 [Uliginosibacterium sp. H3]|uniref:Uncharacterized protein n=1 Tax=Uliginosibacterium silvisoli TaxID=3114758 RepID=A0ABU6K5B0_9RHOO|nr:hypothetical protein [Uliginosibacterium sp. H3]